MYMIKLSRQANLYLYIMYAVVANTSDGNYFSNFDSWLVSFTTCGERCLISNRTRIVAAKKRLTQRLIPLHWLCRNGGSSFLYCRTTTIS